MGYYATRNSQDIGMGITKLYWQSAILGTAKISKINANSIEINRTHLNNLNFRVGQYCAVAKNGEHWLEEKRIIKDVIINADGYVEIFFDGPSIDLVEGVSKIYSQVQRTGLTDNLLTENSHVFGGSPSDGVEAVKFLNMENLWGNVWNILDGIVLYNMKYYVGQNMKDYTSDNSFLNTYVSLNYSVPLQDKNNQDENELKGAYVTDLGFDERYPAYALPYKIGEGGGPDKAYADPFYSKDTLNQMFVPAFGGGYDHSYRAGLFTLRFFWTPQTSIVNLHGGRLIFKQLK